MHRFDLNPSDSKLDKDESKPKISYLLRNYDIGFRVEEDKTKEEILGKENNKAEYLIAEHNSSFKFYSNFIIEF